MKVAYFRGDNVSFLSVISPVYKNEATLEELIERTERICKKLFKNYEHIFVVDASPDNSFALLSKLATFKPHIKVILLSRNFGQHTALRAGMDIAQGNYIAFLDADLEEPPESIENLYNSILDGNFLVVGRRKSRRKNFFKRSTAIIYSKIFNSLSDYKIIDDVTNMRMMNRDYIEMLKKFPERPFWGGVTAWVGIPPKIIDVGFVERYESSYTLRKLLSHARLGIIGFSVKPLRLSFLLGIITCLFSMGFAAFSVLNYFLFGNVLVGYTSVVVLLSFLSGIQFVLLGIIGEYLAEVFLSVKNRPPYLVIKKINCE